MTETLKKISFKQCGRISVRRVASLLSLGAFVLSLFLASGCKKEDIQVYRIAKETPAQETPGAPSSPHDPHESAQSRPQWTVPDGWEVRTPSSPMLLASFGINGKDGQTAV